MSRGDAAAEPEGMVEAQAEARLRESPQLADCPITCQFRDGTLTLWGRVPRYSLKQAARSLIQRVPGVKAVDNRIDVIPLPVSEGPSHDRRPFPTVNRFRTD
jgi:osmotically-inducible protein OsmY